MHIQRYRFEMIYHFEHFVYMYAYCIYTHNIHTLAYIHMYIVHAGLCIDMMQCRRIGVTRVTLDAPLFSTAPVFFYLKSQKKVIT